MSLILNKIFNPSGNITKNVHIYFHDWLSYEKRYLQDLLVILKRLLQNYWKILKNYIASDAFDRFNIQALVDVWPVAKWYFHMLYLDMATHYKYITMYLVLKKQSSRFSLNSEALNFRKISCKCFLDTDSS